MNEKKKLQLDLRAPTTSILSSLLCIVIGVAVGFIFLVLLAWIAMNQRGDVCTFGTVMQKAWADGFIKMIKGGFTYLPNMKGLGQEITRMSALMMTGLSVAFAFKTGLFNIGAAGQYVLGAFGALLCAIVFQLPWWVCLICATLFGAIWGAIPGIFKATLNINEVITCIMTNWIALYGCNTLMYMNGQSPLYNLKTTKTWPIAISPNSKIPDLGLAELFNNPSTTIGIFIAIAAAIVIYIVLNKTTFGYELKACGHNKNAARYAGINEKRNIVLAMVIAGALAGLGAGLYYLSGAEEWSPLASTALPAMGFDGISVALLASSNPLGTILSSLFISHLKIGGSTMNMAYFPKEMSDAISGIIIYLCAFTLLFRTKLTALLFGRKKAKKGE